MPRGSRHLDEPALYIHPDTKQQRNATTKVEVVTLEADGYRPAAEVHAAEDAAGEVEDAEARSAAAKKAAATRARNARAAARKPSGRRAGAAAQTPPSGDTDGAEAADATAIETTEPNSGPAE